MLQAYIDDSGSYTGDRKLFLVALIHRADAWAQFSDDWDAVLRAEPPIDYFKMKEAHRCHEQFRGWSQAKRDRKVALLGEVVAHYRPIALNCFVSRRNHEKYLKPHAPYGLSSPYFPLAFVMICGIARIIKGLGINLPCDVIFDEQDEVSKHVLLFYDYIMGQQPDDWSQYVNSSPIFRSDRDFLPLQAADMAAWTIRREADGALPSEYDDLLDKVNPRGGSYSLEITEEYLRKWGEGMQATPGAGLVTEKARWNEVIQQMLTDGHFGG
jgi:hypothetical protein